MAISGAAREIRARALGLPSVVALVVWAAGCGAIDDRFPLIIWLGGGVLGWVAVKMIFDDPMVAGWLARHLRVCSISSRRGCSARSRVALGWWFARNLARAKTWLMAWKFLRQPVRARSAARRLSRRTCVIWLQETGGRAVTLGELEQILKGRGFAMFLLLMSLPSPFRSPFPGCDSVWHRDHAAGLRITLA